MRLGTGRHALTQCARRLGECSNLNSFFFFFFLASPPVDQPNRFQPSIHRSSTYNNFPPSRHAHILTPSPCRSFFSKVICHFGKQVTERHTVSFSTCQSVTTLAINALPCLWLECRYYYPLAVHLNSTSILYPCIASVSLAFNRLVQKEGEWCY